MKQELIKIFKNDVFGNVRVVLIGKEGEVEEAWFVGKDVAEALGYANTRDALSKLDDDERKDGVAIYDSIGRKQKVVAINESGLYSLIFSSQLESAKQFRRWVTSEVLPSIRRHGAYITSEIQDKLKENPNYITELLNEMESTKNQNELLQHRNAQLAEANQYYHTCFDEVMEFIADNLKYSKGKTVSKVNMYGKYCRWCSSKNYAIYGNGVFHELMQERVINGHAVVISQGKYLNVEVGK